jgi:tetratricopeptide (TPR) repeat protein
MLILPLVIVAGFWFSPRYRLPVIPLLCVTTAAAIVYAVRDVRAEARKPGPIIGVILLTAVSIATGRLNHATLFDRMESSITSYVDNWWRLYDETGDYEAAVDHFQRLRQRFPDHPRLFPSVVQAFLKVNRFDDARRMCREVTAKDPRSIEAWLSLGKIAMTQQRWAEAEEAFARCLQIDPQNADAHSGRWWVLTQLGRRQEAIPHLIEAVRLNPDDPLSALGYGIHLAEQGRLEEAEKQLRHAISLAPNEPKAHFNLALALRQLGRPAEAVPFAREALRLNPSYQRAQQLLTDLTADSGAGKETIASIRAELVRQPKNGALYSKLAGRLYAEGDAAGAISVLRQGLDRADDITTVAVELAWLLSTCRDDRVRNGEEAVNLMDSVIGRVEKAPPQLLDVYAAALAEAARFQEAVKQAERAAAAAESAGDRQFAEAIRQRIELYKSGSAYRQ